MKKCPGCKKELDKYAIACEYCGKMTHEDESVRLESSKNEDGESKDQSQNQ